MDKRLILLTLVFLLISLGFLGYKQITTGFFIDKSIELEGGNLIIVSFKDATIPQITELRDSLANNYGLTAYVTTSAIETQLSIETSQTNLDQIINDINSTLEIKNYDVSEIDPKLSAGILSEILSSVVIAFIAIAAIIFILFRVPVPSFAVVFCAFADIIETLFIMNLIGIPLSITTFTALLMLLGYSVDTDILLTTRTLKDRDKPFKNQYRGALKTGLTMTATSLVALTSILLVTGYSSVFGQLASVLIIALIVDLPNTWIQNSIILEWYLGKK